MLLDCSPRLNGVLPLEEQARKLRNGNQDRKWVQLRGLIQNRHLGIGSEGRPGMACPGMVLMRRAS